MSRIPQNQSCPSAINHDWSYAVVFLRKPRLRKLQLEFGENVERSSNVRRPFPDPLSHFQQDSVDFGEFFFEQAHQFVVLFNSFKRLDENCLSAGTCAVDYALYPPLVLSLNWNYKAFATDGDHCFLCRAAFGQPPQITLQRLLDRAF